MHELNEIKRQNEEIFNIAFGYNGHLRYEYNDLVAKLKDAIHALEETWEERREREKYEIEKKKDREELERIRDDLDCANEMSYWDDLFEIYQIVFDDIDAYGCYKFKDLKMKLLETFPTDNLKAELIKHEKDMKKWEEENDKD